MHESNSIKSSMDYVDIKAIENNKSLSNLEKIDALLKADCSMYTRLGTDSTAEEKAKVKAASREVYKAIKRLGDESFLMLVDASD